MLHETGKKNVSILAPARGATLPFFRVIIQYAFQFSPLQEGRHNTTSFILISLCFNSRPCKRGDVERHLKQIINIVSILAPARGATYQVKTKLDTVLFQFSPLQEGRRYYETAPAELEVFQFSPLQEGRPGPRKGCPGYAAVSILAPARGATRPPQGLPGLCGSFNSRPCKRGDFYCFAIPFKLFVSILAPARGATILLILVYKISNFLANFANVM